MKGYKKKATTIGSLSSSMTKACEQTYWTPKAKKSVDEPASYMEKKKEKEKGLVTASKEIDIKSALSKDTLLVKW